MRNLYNELTTNNGYTATFSNLGEVKTGYVIGIVGETFLIPRNITDYQSQQRVFDKLVDRYFAKTAIGNEYCFGAWIEGDKVYYDICRNVDNLELALTIAQSNNQLAIFHVDTQNVIHLPKPQTHGTEWQKESYAKELAKKLASGSFELVPISSQSIKVIPL